MMSFVAGLVVLKHQAAINIIHFYQFINLCLSCCVCVDHRKSISLPHHHPFRLFLGGSQAPVWNGLPPVSTLTHYC